MIVLRLTLRRMPAFHTNDRFARNSSVNPSITLGRIRILTTTLNNNIHHPATADCRQSLLSRSPDFVDRLAVEAIILFFLNHDT